MLPGKERIFFAAWKMRYASENRENNPEICGRNIRESSPDSDMKNAVGWPETARVAIMQSAPNPAGGILNLIGATRGKLCEESRLVRGRLSEDPG